MPLNNRNNLIPGGFKFKDPRTGLVVASGSLPFETVAILIRRHRLANPTKVTQFSLATEIDAIRDELDNYSCLRGLREGWYASFCTGLPPLEVSGPFPASPSQPRQGGVPVVAGISKIASGIRTLADWLGEGGMPIGDELANQRAAICAGCPKNDESKGNFFQTLTAFAAEQIHKQLELRNKLELKTPYDDGLFICSACWCVLKLKVHAPLDVVKEGMTEAVRKDLDPRCWILNEK